MIITAGIYKGRKLATPSSSITRPTLSKVRMGVFNSLYSILGDFSGKTFLDLFGGSGIMGLEALSRGFESVDVYEINRSAAEIIKKNYGLLGLKPNLTVGDTLKLLDKTEQIYDVIYVDPPYESGIYEEILPKLGGKSRGEKSAQRGKYIIAEHTKPINQENYKLLKQKNYGGKLVSILVAE